jgi:beta-N-acetylhexosaminidase
VIYPQIDSRCAGFSSVWIQEILRGQLGFEGVVFSDDLTMDAAHSAGSIQTRCEFAMSAGCDMVLVCNDNQAAAEICDFLEANPGRHAVESQERLLRMRGKRPVANAVTAARSRYEKAASLLATLS